MKECNDFRDDSSFYILSKFKCYYLRLETENYWNYILELLGDRDKLTKFVRYVYLNHKSFSDESKLALVTAFIRFQEECVKTYNLESRLQDPNTILLKKDWKGKGY